MNTSPAQPLAGLRILVTRPQHQAAHLANLITAAGGDAVLFPLIAITPPDNAVPLTELIDRLHEFDIAIFVSPNAAAQALAAISARRAMPPSLQLVAIGRGSALELERRGYERVIAPQRYDSEALLELAEMKDVAGKRIIIFRAQDGREVLSTTLRARGASVTYAACYCRRRTQADIAPLCAAWLRGEIDAVTATSSVALRYLFELLSEPATTQLRATPLFVSHPRIAESARALGLRTVITTAQGDAGLVQGMIAWAAASALKGSGAGLQNARH